MKTSIRLTKVDFSQSWSRIIFQDMGCLVALIVSVTIRYVFATLEPFLIAFVLERQSWYVFAAACVLWIVSEINLVVNGYLNPRFQVGVIHSILHSAHQYLLTVDPLYHANRSSGVVLAKIDRAARGYEDILDQITFQFAPLCIGIISVMIVLGHHSFMLMGGVLFCLIIMLGYAYHFALNTCQKMENDFIQTDDSFKAVAFENLAQIHLVRASFATDFMRDKLTRSVIDNSRTEHALWYSYGFVSGVLNAVYTVSVMLLVAFFMYHIRHNTVSLAYAIGIILAYINCTHKMIQIVHPLRRFMRGYSAVRDLFESINQFGKQTIPVFDGQSYEVKKAPTIHLAVNGLVFGYSENKLFNNNSLTIDVHAGQANKLYGLIGPSGVGKTTLLSILGGQLKPLHGTIILNHIDMYAVNDATRRQLVVMQGQIATSFKGTVRYNLLFGLPEHHGYTDNYLLDVLDRIGLKSVFYTNQGLDTMLGEGALNLSGGQRQRLNFASLYVRALFYKPVVILIDEPTSSLDDISEIAVTNMILELAAKALTIVIAHRLKTVESAVGLIDLSLKPDTGKIPVYTPDELKNNSVYYRTLLEGYNQLD